MNQTDKPTGVPEDVKQKIRDRYPHFSLINDSVVYLDTTNCSLEPFREAAAFGYSLALPELTGKEEEIKRLKGFIEFQKDVNGGADLALETLTVRNHSLEEENAKLKEEIDRLKLLHAKDVKDAYTQGRQDGNPEYICEHIDAFDYYTQKFGDGK